MTHISSDAHQIAGKKWHQELSNNKKRHSRQAYRGEIEGESNVGPRNCRAGLRGEEEGRAERRLERMDRARSVLQRPSTPEDLQIWECRLPAHDDQRSNLYMLKRMVSCVWPRSPYTLRFCSTHSFGQESLCSKYIRNYATPSLLSDKKKET